VRGAAGQYCPPGADTACSSVLVVYAGYPSWAADVQSSLRATGAFTTVDTLPAYSGSGTPTAAQLAAYDAVLVFSDGDSFSDAALLGDRLAAYHDGGGGVVVAYSANAGSTRGYGLEGAYGTPEGGYALLNYSSGSIVGSADALGDVAEPQSPLMAGVAALNATSAVRSTAGVVGGRGVVVARWRGGGREPLVIRGTRGGRTLVELNFYPVSSRADGGGWTGDGAALLRNALKYSRCMPSGPGAGSESAAGAALIISLELSSRMRTHILWARVRGGGERGHIATQTKSERKKMRVKSREA
jgi:hypothetical protein